jgi:Flp pilus assembly protein protease CpaA
LKIAIVLWLAICAWCDMRTGEVPNPLTLPAIAIGAVVAVLNGLGAFALFAIILAALFFLYPKIGIGGADAKILTALAGLWPESLPVVLVGLLVWSLARRLAGCRGSYRAVLPMTLAMLLIFVVDTAGFFP